MLAGALSEQSAKTRFAEYAAELAEGEERDERDEDDDGPGDKLFDVEAFEGDASGLVVDEAFDELLNEVEEKDENAEEKSFQQGGLIERKGFGAAAEVEHLADEDDLTDDEGVDESEGEVEGTGVVVVPGKEHSVGCDGAEEDSEVGGDGEVVLHLVQEPLLMGELCGNGIRGGGHGRPSFFAVEWSSVRGPAWWG